MFMQIYIISIKNKINILKLLITKYIDVSFSFGLIKKSVSHKLRYIVYDKEI